MADGKGREVAGDMGSQHIGDAVLGAPMTGDHQANAFLFSQQSDVVGGLAGDKAIRARINSFLQVAAARTADFGQAGDGAAAIHVRRCAACPRRSGPAAAP